MQQLLSENSKVIAVDFDGTIVEHKYPAIGKEMLFAFAFKKFSSFLIILLNLFTIFVAFP
jgi:hypothetical protein